MQVHLTKLYEKIKNQKSRFSLRFSTVFLSLTASLLFSLSAISQTLGVSATGTPSDPSAGLDVDFTDKGFLIPRVTTAQRDGILNPAIGLQIFNLDSDCLEMYFGTGNWESLKCGCKPTMPIASAGTDINATDFDANWSASTGVDDYYLDVATDNTFTTFVSGFNNLNVGNVTTYNVTGLTCATDYYYRVRAENTCGFSSYSSTITVSTGSCFTCGSSTITFNYRGSSVTYGTVTGQNSTCWMDMNLGASRVATSSTDANSYGDLFQWGRDDDGHQNRGSSTTGTRSTTDSPGHGNFITYGSSPYDWRNPQNDNLWQGVSGTNNPCPAGWRIPTETELDNERASWGSQNAAGAFGSPLKLPVAGYRGSNGSLTDAGSHGNYWSSTVSGTYARILYFFSSGALMSTSLRVFGSSVRCIKD